MKKLLSLLLVVIILFACTPFTLAASKDAVAAADALYGLGLFQGAGVDANGKPIYDLDRTMTRVEAVAMLVRMIGKDREALANTYSMPFSDVPKWAEAYIGYAYSKGLTNGTGPTTFGSATFITVSEYITFILRALAYTSNIDFKWNAAWELSDKLGITHGEYFSSSTRCLRADGVLIAFNALQCKVKGTGTSMLDNINITKNAGDYLWDTCEIDYVKIDNKVYQFNFIAGIDIINPITVGSDKELYVSTYIPKPRMMDGDKRIDHCSSILALLNLMLGEYKITTTDNPYLNGVLMLNKNDIYHESLNQTITIEFDIRYTSLKDFTSNVRYTYNGKTLNQADLPQNSSGGVYEKNSIHYYNTRPDAQFINVKDLLAYFSINKTIRIDSFMGELCYVIE